MPGYTKAQLAKKKLPRAQHRWCRSCRLYLARPHLRENRRRGLHRCTLKPRPGRRDLRFHAEAGIAAEHCFAPSFEKTRWQEIAELYAILERVAPSPLHTLNRAVVIAEWQGPEAGLAALEGVVPPSWLVGSYLWDAVLGDLHRRAGHLEIAQQHRERALASAPTKAVRELLQRRLAPSPSSLSS